MQLRKLTSIVLACSLPLAWQTLTFAQEKSPRVKAQDAAVQANQNKAPKLLASATEFLATLNDAQREKALLPYDSEKRVQWHFIPMQTRKGLPIMEMQESQKKVAMTLLRSALSQVGYNKATKIMSLEKVLKQLEGDKGANERNPEKYYFTIFGTPAPQQPWGLSIEGHHLSLNFSVTGNRIVDSTPQFFATNPAKLMDSYGDEFPKGLEVLGAEEQLGFELVNSLSEDQLAKAKLPGEVPSEIRGASEPQPSTVVLGGIAAKDLDADQQEVLKKLMKAYTNKMKTGVQNSRWKLIDESGFDKIQFGWAGAMKSGAGHYYVVQGPTFVIEFINVQPDAAGNPANHIHCVWRDMQGDFDMPIQ